MGQDLLSRLHGMFAALWDKTTKRLILARDRFGKKPLYFRNWRGAFAFGSRFDTIEALSETTRLRRMDPSGYHAEIHSRPIQRV